MSRFEYNGVGAIDHTITQMTVAATTLTTLYSVTQERGISNAVVQVANRGTASTTFRLSMAKAGAADAAAHYYASDASIAANSLPIPIVIGGLDKTDLLRFYAGNANLSVQLSGYELI